jgi:hypothetical protein
VQLTGRLIGKCRLGLIGIVHIEELGLIGVFHLEEVGLIGRFHIVRVGLITSLCIREISLLTICRQSVRHMGRLIGKWV